MILDLSKDKYEEFMLFVKKFWRNNHPIFSKKFQDWLLFDLNNNYKTKLNIEDGKIIGVFILNELKFYNNNSYENGIETSFLVTDQTNPNSNIYFLKNISENYKNIISGNVNTKTYLPIAKNLNYDFHILNRYVVSLESNSYTNVNNFNFLNNKYTKPIEIDFQKLSILFKQIMISNNIFTIFKDSNYFSWRYQKIPYQKYLFFGNYDDGIIICRIEKINNSNHNVLRIIEVLPVSINVWEGKDNTIEYTKFKLLFNSVLNYAKSKNCIIADFYISFDFLKFFLEDNNFINIINNKNYNCPKIFFDTTLKCDDINFISKSDNKKIYYVKSNTDTDFPNNLNFQCSYNKTFKLEDGKLFSKLSGDYNPIHIDENYSKNSIYNNPIIHGCNLVFQSLIILDKELFDFIRFSRLKSEFFKPTYYNEKVTFIVNKKDFNIVIDIYQSKILKSKVILENVFYDKKINELIDIKKFNNKFEVTTIDNIKVNENIFIDLNSGTDYQKLKNINDFIQSYLFAISRLVGMKIPGLNSILYNFEINLLNNILKSDKLNCKITNIDKRFSSVDLNLNNDSCDINLKAFYRPTNVKQLSYKEVTNYVENKNFKNNFFRNKTVLILGGSKGLGNLLHKIILSIGIKKIIVSYHKTKNVLEENKKFDNLEIINFDVENDKLNDELIRDIDIIFYFVTPIISGEENIFNSELFNKFNKYYVEKFYNLVTSVINVNNKCEFFFPSSEAINTKPKIWKEYYLSKINAENISDFLNKTLNAKIKYVRFPKLLTDQTNTISFNNEVELTNNIDFLLDFIKKNYFKLENKPTNKLAVLSSVNIDPIKNILAEYNFFEDIYICDYGQNLQNLQFNDSKLNKFNPEYILLIDRPEDIIRKDLDYYNNNDDNKIDYYFQILGNYLKNNKNVNFFITTYSKTLETVNLEINYNKLIKDFNNKLLNLKSMYENNIYLIDINSIKLNNIIDKRMWYIGKIPYNNLYFEKIAEKLFGLVLSIKGLTTRLLILDLDNTLWGGVVGEDGIHGIKLGEDYPGNVFVDFQKKIKLLKERGIALAICSKNDLSIVSEVFEKNKNMILKKEDFVYIEANWQPKVDNIRKISEKIGLGLKNILFVDDNPVERDQVKQFLPDVKVLDLPDDPIEYIDCLLSSPYLEVHKLTESDKNRSNTYQKKVIVDKLKEDYGDNKEEFYRHLELEIFINNLTNENKDRCIQLLSKTNQFNTTTLRLTENDILTNNYKVYVLGAKDKYNDYENMGVMVTKELNDTLEIIDYLLSCRFLGKNLENEFIKWILNYSENKKFKKVIGKITETDRNEPVRNIFKNNNFIINENNIWEFNINKKVKYTDYIKINENLNPIKIEINKKIFEKKDNSLNNKEYFNISIKLKNILKDLIDDECKDIFENLIKTNKLYNDINLIPSWTSLKHIIFINKFEKYLGKKLTSNEISNFKLISDFDNLIENVKN